MNNTHGYPTRSTTKISQSIDELAKALLTKGKMANNETGTSSMNVFQQQMELLVTELANLREEIGRLKLQQDQQEPITNDLARMKVIVNTDPLQQMKDFVKVFHGNSDEDVYKWLESIVHYFNVAQFPGNQERLYLQYAPAFLKSYAYEWWKENKLDEWNWEMFKSTIIEQFGKTNEYLIGRQLDQRKQQYNESVIKYYYDVLELCNKYDPTMSNKQKIYKLTNGLQLSLYQEAIKMTYTTPIEFLTKVQQIENIQKLIEHRRMQMRVPDELHNETYSDLSNRYNRYDQRQDERGRTTNNNRVNGQLQCYKCREYGHLSRYCPQAKEDDQSNQKNE